MNRISYRSLLIFILISSFSLVLESKKIILTSSYEPLMSCKLGDEGKDEKIFFGLDAIYFKKLA